jgi:hypothetical protein
MPAQRWAAQLTRMFVTVYRNCSHRTLLFQFASQFPDRGRLKFTAVQNCGQRENIYERLSGVKVEFAAFVPHYLVIFFIPLTV